MEISSRVRVPAAQVDVWRAVVDWSQQHRWMLGTQVRGGHGLGATLVARTGIGPAAFTDTIWLSLCA